MSEPHDPTGVAYHGFSLRVEVDRPVYAPAQPVRITVVAAHDGPHAVEHVHRGWQRVVLSVRDDRHRAVATDELDADALRRPVRVDVAQPARDRWLPGTVLLLPSWWDQRTGVLRPEWSLADPGEPVPGGRYRIRAAWQGREPGAGGVPPEAWSPWFELLGP